MHARLVLDGPAYLLRIVGIADDPAKEHKRLNGLIVRLVVPIIDFPIGISFSDLSISMVLESTGGAIINVIVKINNAVIFFPDLSWGIGSSPD